MMRLSAAFTRRLLVVWEGAAGAGAVADTTAPSSRTRVVGGGETTAGGGETFPCKGTDDSDGASSSQVNIVVFPLF